MRVRVEACRKGALGVAGVYREEDGVAVGANLDVVRPGAAEELDDSIHGGRGEADEIRDGLLREMLAVTREGGV